MKKNKNLHFSTIMTYNKRENFNDLGLVKTPLKKQKGS